MNTTSFDTARPPMSRVRALAGAVHTLAAGAARRLAWRLGASLPARAAAESAWEEGRVLNNGRNDGPPDLDELWRDFNRKLGSLFPGNRQGGSSGQGGSGGPGLPDMKGAGLGIGLLLGLVVLIWLGSGIFIVQEGQQAVVTSFGRYARTAEAGMQLRLPYPFESHETVNVTALRSVEVGTTGVTQGTGLRDSSMLTQDENIVDIQFTVQYRIKDARQFLFENRSPELAVVQAAESAVREIVGRNSMDSVLYEQRDAIAADLVKLIQAQLDRLKSGVLVANVNVRSVQPPEQVQAAFDDAFRAGADRERFKNDGQAYANDVIPKARGAAARLLEEANAHRSRVVAQAEGDAERFIQVHAEYQKAPGVTRDRLYIDTMQQIYSNVTKVLVDSRNGSSLLYLPLDKLLQQAGNGAASSPVVVPGSAAGAGEGTQAPVTTLDPRSRENARGRDRDVR
jgi:membrane protease subunit HflK